MPAPKGPNNKFAIRDQVKLVTGIYEEDFQEELNRELALGWTLVSVDVDQGRFLGVVKKKLRTNVELNH